MKKYIEGIRMLITQNDLQNALKQLNILLETSPQLDEVILQSARFTDIRKQIRLGIVSHEEVNLTKNQIRAGLLDLLQEVETQSEQPAIQQELERAATTIIQNAEKIYNIDKIDKADFS